MKYYIDRVNTWGPANAKCAKLHQEMKQYEHCLVADDIARDALVEQVRQTVEQANADYPRTKRLTVETYHNSVYCRPEKPASDSDNVFSFALSPVRRVFRFAEGGQQPRTAAGTEEQLQLPSTAALEEGGEG